MRLCRFRAGPPRPNIVIILADDLGFSDLGCYGGEIKTPNLDGLAAGGLRFTQFYNTARCWPTRAALAHGYYAQQVRRDTVAGVPSGAQRHATELGETAAGDARMPLGYRSYHSGKWHVDGMPLGNGFDRSYWLEDCRTVFSPAGSLRGRPEATAGRGRIRILRDDGYRRSWHRLSCRARGKVTLRSRSSFISRSTRRTFPFRHGGRHRALSGSISGGMGSGSGGAGQAHPRAGDAERRAFGRRAWSRAAV